MPQARLRLGAGLLLFLLPTGSPCRGNEIDGVWPPELFVAEMRRLNFQDALTFDPATKPSGAITYELTAPAFVRLRIVRRKDVTFVLRTLLDWTWQPAGSQRVEWDGQDSAGQRIPHPAEECFVLGEANSPLHASHLRTQCHDLRLALLSETSPHHPLRGIATFRITLDPGPQNYLARTGITLRYYLDGQRLHQVHYPPGVRGPWTLAVDTTTFSDGPHRLGVAAMDGFDHRAGATLEVQFGNRDPA